ncbi:hypothetical protein MC885_006661, partial [Smutsia gigantea]
TNNLQITVTPTPESFPHGKLLPISPTWPFSEVQSSSAMARIKNVLGPSPDNTSMLQFARTLPPKTRRRARAPGDFSSSPYQASGHGTSLEPSKDSTESLVQPRPQEGREAAAMSVRSSVSPRAAPTAPSVASAALFSRKSSPAALSAALVARGTGSSPSAVASGLAKSNLTAAPAKNVTNNAPGPKATPGAAHPAFSFTPAYMFARTALPVSAHTAMQGNTGAASGLLSTTHLPRKPQAMHSSNLPNPDTPKAPTPRPLTVTAALTSVTAPVRATRLPPLLAENTNAAPPAASTAVVTTGKMASNLECQMSSKLLVKTVLFLTQRRVQIIETLRLNVAKGLTQALRKAFHQNDVSAHFVSPSDNIQSCKFAQTMEQRLQKAFQDAERKVLNTKSNLTIQIVSTSNASQTVILVYVVGNRSSFLNGTVASSLLRQLSAELVGFYLTYPPLTIAERWLDF